MIMRIVEVKDTYKYQVKMGRKVILKDITKDLFKVIDDYQTIYNSHIKQIGRRTTYRAALLWKIRGGHRRYIKHIKAGGKNAK